MMALTRCSISGQGERFRPELTPRWHSGRPFPWFFHASREHRPPRRFSRIGLVDNDVVRMGYELARSSDPAGLVQVGMIARGGHGAYDAVRHSARGVRIALADVADNREQVGARLLRPMDGQRQRRRTDCLCSAAWMMASVSATTWSCGTAGRVSAMLSSTRLRNQASCAWASCWVPNSDSIGKRIVFMEGSVMQSRLRSHLPAGCRALGVGVERPALMVKEPRAHIPELVCATDT